MIGDAAYSLSSAAESEHGLRARGRVAAGRFAAAADPARQHPGLLRGPGHRRGDREGRRRTGASPRRMSRCRWAACRPPSPSIKNASTPNLIIIESLLDRNDMLGELDRLAECLRSRHQGHRHRPCQRRAALSRAAAPRRQRICRGPGQGDADHREHLDHLHRPGGGPGRPGHRLRRRQGRLRLEHRLPQHRVCHRLGARRATW